MVADPNPRKRGQLIHCPEPVAYRGRLRTEVATYRVDACGSHADELSGAVVPIGETPEWSQRWSQTSHNGPA